MIHRHVLAALATGIEAGNDDAARAAVGRTDWILRGAARRRLERALIDAALVSGELVSAADPEAMRHIQRVAALDLAGRGNVDAGDRVAVARAYRGLDTRRGPGWGWIDAPVATSAAVVVVVLAIALLAFTVYRLRHPAHVRPAAPPAVGAYRTGGVPAYDPALEQTLAVEMPRIAWLGGPAPSWLRHALDDRPPGLVKAWGALLDAVERLDRRHVAQLKEAAHALSGELAAQGLGYQVAAYAEHLGEGTHLTPILFVYRVDRVVFVRCDGEPRRVLDLRRIDHVRLERFVLGLESSEVGDPMVMLDRVEEFVATHVRPLAGGGPYELGDDSFRRSFAGARLAAAAGDGIRAELTEPLVELFAASVRRHEARHSIDVDHDLELPTPPPLAKIAGDGPFVVRARAELAAYLTQIAYDPALPQLDLWNFANQAFDSDYSYGAEGYAAVVALEGLARHVGGGVRPPAFAHGRLDRGVLAETALPLAHVSDDQLRTAARELFVELFGEPPVAIYDSRR